MTLEEKLSDLKKKGVTVYSFSRLGTITNCLAEAHMTYDLHLKQRENIYTLLGSKTHAVLEDIVNNKATEADLLPALKQELEDMDTLGLSFPKDFKGGDTIRDGWVTDMTHFCTTYKSPQGSNLHTEELFLYQTPKGRWLCGYIDLYRENADGSIDIFDYKTSSRYTGEAILEHSRQLTLYGLAKEQEGRNVNGAAWIMLKYVTVKYLGYKTAKSKEKTWIEKVIERKNIAKELSPTVESDLLASGMDEVDAEMILHDFSISNTFDCLPEDIRGHYEMKPLVEHYPFTEETKAECIKYIDDTIDLWESMDHKDTKEFKPRSFTKTNKLGKTTGDYFYCTTLCGHFNNCSYIHDYLDQLASTKETSDDDLF